MIGTELHQIEKLKALDPREFPKTFPLLTFFTTVSAEWLTTPMSVISQITSNFAHLDSAHLLSGTITSSVIFVVLRVFLPSRHIVIAFVLGGFFAINIKDAVTYFANPSSQLSATQLRARLAYLQNQRHLPEEHKFRIEDRDRKDWQSLRNEELDLNEAICNYSILASKSALDSVEPWRIKEQDTKRRLQAVISQKKLIEEKVQVLSYITPNLGSSASSMCLGKSPFSLLR